MCADISRYPDNIDELFGTDVLLAAAHHGLLIVHPTEVQHFQKQFVKRTLFSICYVRYEQVEGMSRSSMGS